MKRMITLAALLALGVVSIGLYLLENETERLQRQLAGLDRELLQEQKTLQVLKAEWSYLNQPERLQELTVRYIDRVGLRPLAPEQTVRFSELPRIERPAGATEVGTTLVSASDALPRPQFKPETPKRLWLAGTRPKP